MRKYDKIIDKNYLKMILKGDKLFQERKFEETSQLYLKVSKYYKVKNNERLYAEILKKIVDCYFGMEKYIEALEYLKEIEVFSAEIKNLRLKASVLSDIGLVYKENSDIEHA